jgi:hypothetical protein
MEYLNTAEKTAGNFYSPLFNTVIFIEFPAPSRTTPDHRKNIVKMIWW